MPHRVPCNANKFTSVALPVVPWSSYQLYWRLLLHNEATIVNMIIYSIIYCWASKRRKDKEETEAFHIFSPYLSRRPSSLRRDGQEKPSWTIIPCNFLLPWVTLRVKQESQIYFISLHPQGFCPHPLDIYLGNQGWIRWRLQVDKKTLGRQVKDGWL